MSEAIAFDTRRFVKRLTGGGFTEQPADEHVALLNGNLATKIDIAKLEARMEAIKSDLMKWMSGLLIPQGGLIVALVKLLQRCRRRSIRGRSGNERLSGNLQIRRGARRARQGQSRGCHLATGLDQSAGGARTRATASGSLSFTDRVLRIDIVADLRVARRTMGIDRRARRQRAPSSCVTSET